MLRTVVAILIAATLAGAAAAKPIVSVGLGAQVYSPAESVAKSVYGTGVGPVAFVELREATHLAFRFGIGFVRQSGNAYAGSPYFANGPRSYQALAPMELALCGRIPLSITDSHSAITIVLGGGVQRAFLREKYPEERVTRGSGFTTLFFVGPEFSLGGGSAINIEYRVTSGTISLRNDDRSGDVDLEASAVQFAVRRSF